MKDKRSVQQWSLRDPSGQAHEFRNLVRFIAEHSDLFDAADLVPYKSAKPQVCLAYVHLSHLRPGHIQHVAKWKGWCWIGNELVDVRHRSEKRWELQAPDGTLFEFFNLVRFLDEHRDLFEPNEVGPKASTTSPAYLSLARLRPGHYQRQQAYRGWTWAGGPPLTAKRLEQDGGVWTLIAPDGNSFKVAKIARFVREHVELFDARDLEAFPSTPALNRATSNLSQLRRGALKAWKGWRWSQTDPI